MVVLTSPGPLYAPPRFLAVYALLSSTSWPEQRIIEGILTSAVGMDKIAPGQLLSLAIRPRHDSDNWGRTAR